MFYKELCDAPYAKLKFCWMILDSKFQFLGINRVVQNWCTYMIRGYVESTFLNSILDIPTGPVCCERWRGLKVSY